MTPTRWYILMGLVAWPLSCVLVYFLASDAGYSRAIEAADEETAAPTRASSASLSTPGGAGSFRRSGGQAGSPHRTFAGESFADGGSGRAARIQTPLQRLAAATSIRNPQFQRAELGAVVASFTLQDVQQSLSEIVRMAPGPTRERMLRSVLGRWSQLEPKAALAFALEEASPLRRRTFLQDVFRGWATADPAAALAYAEAPENDAVDRSVFRAVFEGLGSADPETALAFVSTLDVERYGRGLSQVIRDLYTADPDRLVAWAGGLPDGALQRMVTPMVVDQWGRYDPEAALAWVDAQGPIERRTLQELGESWARMDPQGAMDWYATLPNDQKDPRIVNSIFDRWLRYEPETAASWIVDQPATEELDHTLDRYVQSMSRESPDIALEWAMAIVNDRRRQVAVDRIMGSWLRARPEGAVEYLKTSPLPEEVTRDLLVKAEEAARARAP